MTPMDWLSSHYRRPLWSRILFTLADMGERCCVPLGHLHPAERWRFVR